MMISGRALKPPSSSLETGVVDASDSTLSAAPVVASAAVVASVVASTPPSLTDAVVSPGLTVVPASGAFVVTLFAGAFVVLLFAGAWVVGLAVVGDVEAASTISKSSR